MVSCHENVVHASNKARYHYKCLKIARGKVKEDDKYTCPICDWRMKIPRDASRPKLEELLALAEEMATLPFQPEEEEVLNKIIDNAQNFRNHIANYCNPLLSTEAEAETQRFYLRKIEGAEVLLTYETNFFRQELHKWCPVAPEAPPIQEQSRSTRKPRPTKLQKMLVEYGVDNPDDLPEHARGKANSLRRKAANAEAAAAAASHSMGGIGSGYGGSGYYPRSGEAGSPNSHGERRESQSSGHSRTNSVSLGNGMHAGPLGAGGPQLVVDNSSMSLEDRILQGHDDGLNFQTDAEKSKALEILARTELGRKQAEAMWGPNVWGTGHGSIERRVSNPMDEEMIKQEEGNVDQMFKEMTNQDEDDEKKIDAGGDVTMTTASLEKERNGMDALLDGE